MSGRPWAYFAGLLATDLVEVADLTSDAAPLDRGGWWAVVGTFEGVVTGYRFASVLPAALPAGLGWHGPAVDRWRSSLDEDQYISRIGDIKRHIEAGDVYQVNLCRLLSADLPAGADDPAALAGLLSAGNPAPYQGVLHTGDEWLVTASPELFLSRDGDTIASSPIKGTAAAGSTFAEKDTAENIMITDLMRNDLNRICRPDSVRVTGLLQTQAHPGLLHLVSTVQGRLRSDVGWAEIFAATFPPGSVSGAPKIRALEVIAELEPVPRGPYCGAVGFVDADRRHAQLAVGIRTFFTSTRVSGRRQLHFGTGAGITYPSDARAEWVETELKAQRLIALASETVAQRRDRSLAVSCHPVNRKYHSPEGPAFSDVNAKIWPTHEATRPGS